MVSTANCGIMELCQKNFKFNNKKKEGKLNQRIKTSAVGGGGIRAKIYMLTRGNLIILFSDLLPSLPLHCVEFYSWCPPKKNNKSLA